MGRPVRIFGPLVPIFPADQRRLTSRPERGSRMTASRTHTIGRETFIARAIADYHCECRHKTVVCSLRTWVSDSLREAGREPLMASEIKARPELADDNYPPDRLHTHRRGTGQMVALASEAAKTRRHTTDRQTFIAWAIADYHCERRHKTVVCSLPTWVSGDLREAGREPLMPSEIAARPELADDDYPRDRLHTHRRGPGKAIVLANAAADEGHGYDERQAVINQAIVEWKEGQNEKGGKIITSIIAWVNETLRELGMPRLTKEEKEQLEAENPST